MAPSQLCGQSCHCPVQFESPQLTADIPNFDASLPANFSTHQVKSISFADSASWVTDQIPIAARHAGHPRIPSFRWEGYLPAATSHRPAQRPSYLWDLIPKMISRWHQSGMANLLNMCNFPLHTLWNAWSSHFPWIRQTIRQTGTQTGPEKMQIRRYRQSCQGLERYLKGR